ncbi:pilus assembly protein [Anaerobacillus sp. CMMVII]|uniref:TadE/TadG family type IV pilus assembly protein n=1 Tax=Anaerobacillus sp. CMMVII TaxID=2755588 RepID=UPI0021B7E133|nr:TadE family protein [Anaerobacillus sp. CMMVII]MCT8136521.1 pilus assembly protein [Anaerobacillus sp. CMMVII]
MRSEEGQALVEFALVFMLVALLFCGIIDFGRIFHAYLALDHAGREAARSASIGGTDEEIRNTAKQTSRHLEISDTNINIQPVPSNRVRGVYTTVTITYHIEFITPLIGKFFPENSLKLEAKSVMRVE